MQITEMIQRLKDPRSLYAERVQIAEALAKVAEENLALRQEWDKALRTILEVEKERDGWERACIVWKETAEREGREANHLRKVGALLEARCLGAERVRDDLTDERDAARAANVWMHDHLQAMIDSDWTLPSSFKNAARSALSDHQAEGHPSGLSNTDPMRHLTPIPLSDHQTEGE
jgi:hypothetical protein